MIVAFIFARGGSKGLPGKNLRMLLGKPLLAHAIDCVATSKHVNKIIVATDSHEIAKVAYEHGAGVIIRPDELCTDEAPEWLSWQHAIKNVATDMFVSVPATCPLRVATDIDDTIEALGQAGYKIENFKAAVTVTEARPNFLYTGIRRYENGAIYPFRATRIPVNRQASTPGYHVVGSCYALWPQTIEKQDHLFYGSVKGVIVPPERAIDIDTPFDFELVESLLLNKHAKKMMEEQGLHNLMRRVPLPQNNATVE